MQHLEVSSAVRPLKSSLGFKRLSMTEFKQVYYCVILQFFYFFKFTKLLLSFWGVAPLNLVYVLI